MTVNAMPSSPNWPSNFDISAFMEKVGVKTARAFFGALAVDRCVMMQRWKNKRHRQAGPISPAQRSRSFRVGLDEAVGLDASESGITPSSIVPQGLF
jgi:hypothetical protein